MVFVADDLGFLGPGIPDLVTELCPPRDTAKMLRKVIEQRRDASPQSTCRAEQKPGPRKPQIRNVQISNVAVLELGTEKVPQRNCVTKILPNVRVNFLVRFASKPLFYWEMTGNPLELFRKFFVAVRAIFWFCGSFFAPD